MKLKFLLNFSPSGAKKPAELASDSQRYISGEVSFGARWEDIISKWLVFEKGEQAYEAVLTDDKFDESLNLSLSSGMLCRRTVSTKRASKSTLRHADYTCSRRR